MFGDYTKTEAKIKDLIRNGKIKSEHDFDNISINQIYEKYGLCVKDLLCYLCYKSNNFTCKHPCSPE